MHSPPPRRAPSREFSGTYESLPARSVQVRQPVYISYGEVCKENDRNHLLEEFMWLTLLSFQFCPFPTCLEWSWESWTIDLFFFQLQAGKSLFCCIEPKVKYKRSESQLPKIYWCHNFTWCLIKKIRRASYKQTLRAITWLCVKIVPVHNCITWKSNLNNPSCGILESIPCDV